MLELLILVQINSFILLKYEINIILIIYTKICQFLRFIFEFPDDPKPCNCSQKLEMIETKLSQIESNLAVINIKMNASND